MAVDKGETPAKKSICARIPLDVVEGMDLYSDWSGKNRTDSIIELIRDGLKWNRMTSEFGKVWEDMHRDGA